ncbi:MAG TPA: hypothetical protein VF131_08095 [Blastocatellia bacterium]|nr:hypothetical protein [Blastocatellia bacterium]
MTVFLVNSSLITSQAQNCGRANPTVSITPVLRTAATGQQLTYEVTITNNDSVGCPASTFEAMASFADSGFLHIPVCVRITLSPGESGSRRVVIQTPPSACSGPVLIRENVVNLSARQFSGFAETVVQLKSLGPNCGLGTCLPVSSDHKPKQSLSNKLDVLRNNEVPSAFGAAFYQMARRFLLGLAPANQFEVSAFNTFRQLSPEVRNLMSCAVESFDNLPDADRVRLFAPELTNKGTEPITPEEFASSVSNELNRRLSLAAFGDPGAIFVEQPGLPREIQRQVSGGVLSNVRPVISRVNSIRTNDFRPSLRSEDFTGDELQQVCRPGAGGIQSCDTLTVFNPNLCPGNSVQVGGGMNQCLRVTAVVPGNAVTLQGFNFISPDITVRITGVNPVRPTTELITHVFGDLKTPQKTTVGGVETFIADGSVNDIITFKIPEGFDRGVYSIQLVVPPVPELGTSELTSAPQFIEVLPDPRSVYQITAETLHPIEETACSLFGINCPSAASDEVGLRFIAQRIELDATPGAVTITDLRFGDVDSCRENDAGLCVEPIDLNRAVFNGSNLGGVALCIVGYEIDGESAFREQINSFTDAFIDTIKDNSRLLSAIISLGAGALKLGLIGPWTAAIAAAILVAIVVGVAIWAPADLIIEDAIALSTNIFAGLTDELVQLPGGSTFETDEDIVVGIIPIEKVLTTLPGGGPNRIYREQRQYSSRGEDSRYDIFLRYNRFLP